CLSSPLLLYSPRALRDLHPFPTRRSSDLGAVRARRSPHRRGLRGRGPACATEALNMRSSRVRSAAPRSAPTRGSRPPGRTRAPRVVFVQPTCEGLLDVWILTDGSFVSDTSCSADMNHVGLTDGKHDVQSITDMTGV